MDVTNYFILLHISFLLIGPNNYVKRSLFGYPLTLKSNPSSVEVTTRTPSAGYSAISIPAAAYLE